MNLLDLVIVVLLLGLAGRGLQAGLFRQVGSLTGFVAGLMLGVWLTPSASHLLGNGPGRSLLIIMLVFLLASAVGSLGELAGLALARGAHKVRLGFVDETAGAVFGVAVGLIVSWLLASMFVRAPFPELRSEIQTSAILRTLDRTLPPAPDIIARFERTLAPNGFPNVFAGLEPAPAAPVTGPNAAAVNAAAAAGGAATVQIIGAGCGGELEGTGFVAAPGLVATNAHVVAGITSPIVIDAAGRHRATVVAFDPDLDFAVLRVSNLAAAPLPLATTVAPRGTVGAVLGYPGGGPFTIQAAAVLGHQTAVGRNIYDRGLIKRDIYQLQSIVRPGNSGGPVVTPDGTVIGVVFAMSTVNDQVGYALTTPEILPDLQAAATSGPVSTSTCTAE